VEAFLRAVTGDSLTGCTQNGLRQLSCDFLDVGAAGDFILHSLKCRDEMLRALDNRSERLSSARDHGQ